MANSLQKVLVLWGAALLIFSLSTIAVSYFFTGYQAKQLNRTLQKQNKQLQTPVPQVPKQVDTLSITAKVSETDIASLLTQTARQQNVSLHYQQNPERPQEWLVGVSGTYQRAIRLIASVMQTQHSQRAFPFTRTLRWEDTGQNTGKLSWQFLWLTVNDNIPAGANSHTLFKNHFPLVTAEPLKCLSKPRTKSNTHISDWSLVELVAIQTSPLKKALLSRPGQPLLTLTESSWIENPLMQLQSIDREHVVFQQWQKEAGCWSTKPVRLHLIKDNNLQ